MLKVKKKVEYTSVTIFLKKKNRKDIQFRDKYVFSQNYYLSF